MSKRIIYLFAFLILFAVSCDEQLETKKPDTLKGDPSLNPAINPNGRASKDPGGVSQLAPCGTSVSGSYSVISSYYNYPQRDLNVGCAAMGATITVNFDAVEIPNRFNIRDAGGSLIWSSGWRGYASYGGPWGSSLSVSASGSYSFTKASSAYYIQVETVTPPNYSYSPNQDAWYASSSCTCAPAPCPTCPAGRQCVNGSCVCINTCGGNGSGSYSTINSFYIYPNRAFDVSCAATGATITVSVQALDIPNRFTIRDAGNSYIAGTSWLGYATYPGMWGMSLSGPSSQTFTFTKAAGVNTYYLQVETLTPPNYSYNPNQDAWYATLSCPN